MADFTITPHEVVEADPIYNNLITQSESMKKEFLNLSTTPLQRYQLTFKNCTTAKKDLIIAHYNAQYAGFAEFAWTSVPSYIESGANITGRWIDGSRKITPVANGAWNIQLTIEKST